ncbi:ABC transporter permease [Halobellus clavatus]|mgnify:FL=1|jgi:osmoprotectant transport system permease protein|uniref:Osmoprotectant transport system permease protein n=1 Tax=Halobellus clavatus TaxID=660517 RepID=A0A1H3IHS2_9EURY|nr:ABC transporter permease [Halobellus clavatus]SDY27230.1 osmoprotectant transport system permease protein [Halobellus clavatus]
MSAAHLGVVPLFISPYLEFVVQNVDQLFARLIEHILITAETVLIAVPIGVSLGVLITYNDRAATAVLWLAGIAMTIPSLAAFGLLVPFLGIGSDPVVFTLILYSQLPVIRNTYVGLTGVEEATKEAGKGLGMTRQQRLRRIQIPMALPIILAGVRNAVVIVVGVAAVGAYIGAGGLGEFIFNGIRQGDSVMIVVATIIVSLLALVADYGIATVEQLLRIRNGEQVEQRASTQLIQKAR